MRVVAIIFARGGSKELPGKNIRPLVGKPLIAWSIEQAYAVNRIERVIVSTDSEEIAKVGRQYGAEVPFMRPSELALDNSPEWLAWRHALEYLKNCEGWLPDLMLSIPTTAPLRLPIDIENCIDEFEKGDIDVVVTVTEAKRNPFYNMVKDNPDGTVSLVQSHHKTFNYRQEAPRLYDMTTVAYGVKPQIVFTRKTIFEGKVKAVHVPLERSIDIDTLKDFKIAEFFLSQQQKDT